MSWKIEKKLKKKADYKGCVTLKSLSTGRLITIKFIFLHSFEIRYFFESIVKFED